MPSNGNEWRRIHTFTPDMHGCEVKCKRNNIYCNGKISHGIGFNYYLCTNNHLLNGNNAPDMLGYRYSWGIYCPTGGRIGDDFEDVYIKSPIVCIQKFITKTTLSWKKIDRIERNMHGWYIKGMYGNRVFKGRISCGSSRGYICTDNADLEGDRTLDRFGYLYSWALYYSSCMDSSSSNFRDISVAKELPKRRHGMKIGFHLNGNGQCIKIKYTDDEVKHLKGLWAKLELASIESINFFGTGKTGRVMRGIAPLLNFLGGDASETVDDVNATVVNSNGALNLAIFRAIPDENNELILSLGRMLDIDEANTITSSFAKIYTKLFNIAEGEIEIVIKKKS